MSKYLLIAVTCLANNNLKSFSSAAETAKPPASMTGTLVAHTPVVPPVSSGCFALFRRSHSVSPSSLSVDDIDGDVSPISFTGDRLVTAARVPITTSVKMTPLRLTSTVSPTPLTGRRLNGALLPSPVNNLHELASESEEARLAAEMAETRLASEREAARLASEREAARLAAKRENKRAKAILAAKRENKRAKAILAAEREELSAAYTLATGIHEEEYLIDRFFAFGKVSEISENSSVSSSCRK